MKRRLALLLFLLLACRVAPQSECAKLRRENVRLKEELARLRQSLSLTAPDTSPPPLDPRKCHVRVFLRTNLHVYLKKMGGSAK